MPTTSVLSASGGQSDQQNGMSLKIWVPILVIVTIIILAVSVQCWRNWVSGCLHNRRRPNNASTSDTREVTAEELAGTINGTNPTTGNATNRTRRIRRTRRTPSQISTTSLPAYAKEPGEQELVIFRGPEGMEDAGMPPATVVMEPLSEDGEDTMHSRNNSHSTQYPPIPAPPVDTPLLDWSESSGESPGRLIPQPSMDTLQTSEEGNSMLPTYDDRGQAPAYRETVDNIGPTVAIDLPPGLEPVPTRRSGLRTLLHSLPNRFSVYTTSHTRADSSSSMASSENTHGVRETSQSRAFHRSSHSGSSSLLTLSPFRPLSRQSNVDLNSPSLISLNSISAPLTHTLTRTGFTYPKNGPTPEQLKLISSRESFARFAVPYGPDAIAYAASASRQDMDDLPPPDFDAHWTAGPSRTSDSGTNIVSSGAPVTSLSQQDAVIESILANDFLAPMSLSRRAPVIPLSPTADEQSRVNPLQVPLPSSPDVSEDESLPQSGIEPLLLPKPSTMAHEVRPVSYRAPSTFEDLPESRASSIASFATAAETIASRSPSRFNTSSKDDTQDEEETPTTPKIGANHVMEHMDAI